MNLLCTLGIINDEDNLLYILWKIFEPPTSCTPFNGGCVHSVVQRPLCPYSTRIKEKSVHSVHCVHYFHRGCTRIAHETGKGDSSNQKN